MSVNTPKQPEKSTQKPYNPFFIALNGISLLFTNALSVGIVILLFSAVSVFMASSDQDGQLKNKEDVNDFVQTVASLQPEQWAMIGLVTAVIVVFAMVAGAMLHGIQSYTALKLSRGEKTTIGEAFSAVLAQLGGYIVLYLWMNLKIALWTLLFIIPGINAYYRYSFAGILFFDKQLPHEKALKESSRLTKGGIITLLTSNMLFNIITIGYITNIITIATQSELYREYTKLDASGSSKPSIHWLSWLTIGLPFILIAGFIVLSITIAIIIALVGSLLTN